MRKFLTLTAAAAFVAAFGFAVGPVSAQTQKNCSNSGTDAIGCIITKGAELQSDHALFTSATDDAIFCGVTDDTFAEPWTLHVAASAPSTAGTVIITFDDNDSITFAVAAGSSFSTVQGLGGVPTVDTLVRITAGGGVTVMMVSAKARKQATDPFDEAGDGGSAESDNYCLTASDANPDDPGADVFPASTFPNN